jgi:predicted ester cyclase
MGTDGDRGVVRRFVGEVLNQGRFDAVAELVLPDPILRCVGVPGELDRDGHIALMAGLRAAVPDREETAEETVAEGDTVVTRLTGRGTHRGAFMGIPPTGRRVDVESVQIDRFAGGRIAERWLLPATFGLLRQLGAVPAPAPAAV